jgi:hypothetical protein
LSTGRIKQAAFESVGNELSAMTSAKGQQWESIDHATLKLGMSDSSSTEIFLFGYTAADFETSGTKAAPCAGNNEVYRLEDPAPFFNAAKVANNLARKARKAVDYRAVYEDFSPQNPLLFAEGQELFYVTGAIACDALDVVTSPGQWQERIAAGVCPADVLRELLWALLHDGTRLPPSP